MISFKRPNTVTGLRFYISVLRIRDLTTLICAVFVLFPYGTSWTGMSAPQLVALRLIISTFCLIPLIQQDAKEFLRSTFGKVTFAYGSLLLLRGLLAPISPGNAVLQGMLVILISLSVFHFTKSYGPEMLIRTLFLILIVITFSMDLFAFKTGGKGVLTWDNEYVASSNYIFGDKFIFSYINMLSLVLISARFNNLLLSTVSALVEIYFCSLVGCSTGVVGIVLILIILLIGNCLSALRINVISPLVVPIIILTMAVIAVGAPKIMQMPSIQNITVNILGESDDFTGRLTIYPHLIDLWTKHLFFGYGSNGAANNAVMQICRAPDAQEGLFHILLSNGLVGGSLFILICYFGFKDIESYTNTIFCLYAFSISMALCSLVEINLGPLFLIAITIAWTLNCTIIDLGNDNHEY